MQGKCSCPRDTRRWASTYIAAAIDPDGGVSIKRWVWERSDEITVDEDGTPSAECLEATLTTDIGVVDEDSWTTIDGATSSVYTPKTADVGRCLQCEGDLH